MASPNQWSGELLLFVLYRLRGVGLVRLAFGGHLVDFRLLLIFVQHLIREIGEVWHLAERV